ncbi:coenzyme F420-0:L-glutamate ligase [Bradyrhizobium sp. CSA207]|uniref:coenzyme F420-0:L-glutamate ligase n=1 Tax=Bradyrhizobium sp. CSA207 TaxID=2698826 RepID=UPI0023AF9E4D|nr:coenzyme F420-0:L-glutamate ligase [Bradyrhizobium sp. CSA207]MDE5445780.1 coenzyme F420-0:L-glutamate ligase [Bradyrhizobium sp. CSA207]
MATVSLHALHGVPDIRPGDDLAAVVLQAANSSRIPLDDGDIVVLAQKIVSKSEDRYVDLESVAPAAEARRLAGICGKDPRIVDLILKESIEVLRCVPGVIIVRHKLGLVLANAGIDQSNLPDNLSNDRALLLPIDPDGSAFELQQTLEARTGRTLGVAIIDSLGRAWRNGTTGICIGASGFEALRDMRGSRDLYGRGLQATVIGVGDELAAAASLVMGQADEGTPIILVKGMSLTNSSARARDLVRPVHQDLFR